MRIAILGRGRLGRSLALLLVDAGVEVALLGRADTVPGDIDALLLAVPDAVIASLGPFGDYPVLHTSGATAFEVLRPHHPAGSFHPLMTFPGPEIGLPALAGVTAALAGDEPAIAIGEALARALGMRPLRVPGDRRLYHAAAVMAGNFATVLLAEAAAVLEAAGVPAEQAPGVLAPLALRSLANAAEDPRRALTGPVARGDEAVVQAHLDALAEAGLADQRAVYAALTDRARALIEVSGPPGETQGDTESAGE